MATSTTGETERFINRYSRPAEKHLREYVLGEVCTKWYHLGLELFDTKDERKLGVIEENNKIHGVEKCCTKMFEKWLEYDDAYVSWDILVKAIRKIGLHHLASQIEKLFMSPSEAAHVQAKVIPSQPDPPVDTSPAIMEKKPQMADLNKIVVPKVMNKWRQLAEGFRYPDEVIAKIKNDCSNIEECCQEFFRDWRSTNHCEGPKTWSKLFDIIKEYTSIAKDIREKMIEEVLKLNVKQ